MSDQPDSALGRFAMGLFKFWTESFALQQLCLVDASAKGEHPQMIRMLDAEDRCRKALDSGITNDIKAAFGTQDNRVAIDAHRLVTELSALANCAKNDGILSPQRNKQWRNGLSSLQKIISTLMSAVAVSASAPAHVLLGGSMNKDVKFLHEWLLKAKREGAGFLPWAGCSNALCIPFCETSGWPYQRAEQAYQEILASGRAMELSTRGPFGGAVRAVYLIGGGSQQAKKRGRGRPKKTGPKSKNDYAVKAMIDSGDADKYKPSELHLRYQSKLTKDLTTEALAKRLSRAKKADNK